MHYCEQIINPSHRYNNTLYLLVRRSTQFEINNNRKQKIMFTVYPTTNSTLLPHIHHQKQKPCFKRKGNLQEKPLFQYARSVLMKNQYTQPKPMKLNYDIAAVDFKKTIKTDRFRKTSDLPHQKNVNRNIAQDTKQAERISPHKQQQIRSFGKDTKPENANKRSGNGRSRINSCKVVLNKVFPLSNKPAKFTNVMNNIQDDALSSIPNLEWDTDKFMSLESFNHLPF